MTPSPGRRKGLLPAVVLLLGTVAAGVAAVVMLDGGPVEVAVPVQADDPACAAASQHWPQQVVDAPSRGTEPSDPTVEAWGDPAVIARCGMPALGPTENRCIVVNGIAWVAEDLGDGTKLTTFGRTPAIEVLVPQEHDPAPQLLPAFAEAAEQLPTNDHSCS